MGRFSVETGGGDAHVMHADHEGVAAMSSVLCAHVLCARVLMCHAIRRSIILCRTHWFVACAVSVVVIPPVSYVPYP